MFIKRCLVGGRWGHYIIKGRCVLCGDKILKPSYPDYIQEERNGDHRRGQ